MNFLSRKSIPSLILYLFAGGILAGFYLVWLQNETPVHGIELAFVMIYLWAFFSLAAFLIWRFYFGPRLKPYRPRSVFLLLAISMAAGFWLADNVPVVLPGGGMLLKASLFLCSGVGVGLLLFGVGVFFVTRRGVAGPIVQRPYHWITLALPMLVAWFIYLLAFWPGMMSADSLDQWGQVLTGHYNNHHPVFHTLLIWLLTRVANTPAIVALAQILALALVVGAILAYIESLGVAPKWVWAASLFFAISPVNGTMVVTLWKDVPYSIAILGFTYLLLRLGKSRGAWVVEKGNWLLLALAAVLAALFRHNGLLVVAFTFPLLLLGFRRQWKFLTAAFVVGAGLYYGITGPGYQLLNVEKGTELVESTTSFYRIAATADPGSQAQSVLVSMNPISNAWQCTLGSSLLEANKQQVDAYAETLPEMALNLVRFSPNLLVYDYRCNRSLGWIVWDPNGEVRNPSHAGYWIDANSFGIEPDSKIPAMETSVAQFVLQTAHDPGINWLVWRPALYFYLFLLVIAFSALRLKNGWILFAAVPVLLQFVSFMLISTPPNFRYYYPAYLLALAFWPLLLAPVENQANAQVPADLE